MAQRGNDFEKIDKFINKNSPQPGPSHSPNGRVKDETSKSDSSEDEPVEKVAAKIVAKILETLEDTESTQILSYEASNVEDENESVAEKEQSKEKCRNVDEGSSGASNQDKEVGEEIDLTLQPTSVPSDTEKDIKEAEIERNGAEKIKRQKSSEESSEVTDEGALEVGDPGATEDDKTSSSDSQKTDVTTQSSSNQDDVGESSQKKIAIPTLQLDDLGEYETISSGRLVINLESTGDDDSVSCSFAMPGTSGQSSWGKPSFKRKICSDLESKSDTSQEEVVSKKEKTSSSDSDYSLLVAASTCAMAGTSEQSSWGKPSFKRKICSDLESKSDTSQEGVVSKKEKASSSDSDYSLAVATSGSTSESGDPGVFRRISESSKNDGQSDEDSAESREEPNQSFFIGHVSTSHNSVAIEELSGNQLNLDTPKESENADVSDLVNASKRKRKISQDRENITAEIDQSKVLRRDFEVEKAVVPPDRSESALANHLPSEDSSAYSTGLEMSEDGESSAAVSGERKREQTVENTNEGLVSESSEEVEESLSTCQRTLPRFLQSVSSATSIPGTPGTANDLYIGDSILGSTPHIPLLPSPIHVEINTSNSQKFNERITEIEADCPSYLKSCPSQHHSPSDEAASMLPSTSASTLYELVQASSSTSITSSDLSDGPASSPEVPITIPMVTLGRNRTSIPQLVYDSIIWTNYENAAEVLWKFFASPPPILIDSSNSQTYRIRTCDVRITEEVEDDIVDIVSKKSHARRKEVRKVLQDLNGDHVARRTGCRKEPKRRRGDAEDADDEEDGDKENSSGNANSADSDSD